MNLVNLLRDDFTVLLLLFGKSKRSYMRNVGILANLLLFILIFHFLQNYLCEDFSFLMFGAMFRLGRRTLLNPTTPISRGQELARGLDHQQYRGVSYVFSGSYSDMPCNHPIIGIVNGYDTFGKSVYLKSDGTEGLVETKNVNDTLTSSLGVGITKDPAVKGIPGRPIGKDNKGDDRFLSDDGHQFDNKSWHSKTYYRPRSTHDAATEQLKAIKNHNWCVQHAKDCQEFEAKNPGAVLKKTIIFLATSDKKIQPLEVSGEFCSGFNSTLEFFKKLIGQ
jgi:hypothetical protein